VILYMDGGICSQLNLYVARQLHAMKGFNTSYDINFYENNGLDSQGVHVCNIDLVKLYPDIRFKRASNLKIGFF